MAGATHRRERLRHILDLSKSCIRSKGRHNRGVTSRRSLYVAHLVVAKRSAAALIARRSGSFWTVKRSVRPSSALRRRSRVM
jgi:hypothetical protein